MTRRRSRRNVPLNTFTLPVAAHARAHERMGEKEKAARRERRFRSFRFYVRICISKGTRKQIFQNRKTKEVSQSSSLSSVVLLLGWALILVTTVNGAWPRFCIFLGTLSYG